MILPKKKSFQN